MEKLHSPDVATGAVMEKVSKSSLIWQMSKKFGK